MRLYVHIQSPGDRGDGSLITQFRRLDSRNSVTGLAPIFREPGHSRLPGIAVRSANDHGFCRGNLCQHTRSGFCGRNCARVWWRFPAERAILCTSGQRGEPRLYETTTIRSRSRYVSENLAGKSKLKPAPASGDTGAGCTMMVISGVWPENRNVTRWGRRIANVLPS